MIRAENIAHVAFVLAMWGSGFNSQYYAQGVGNLVANGVEGLLWSHGHIPEIPALSLRLQDLDF